MAAKLLTPEIEKQPIANDNSKKYQTTSNTQSPTLDRYTCLSPQQRARIKTTAARIAQTIIDGYLPSKGY